MFFEGSEKKAEVIVDSGQVSLLEDYTDDFWTAMVDSCCAHVLSKMDNGVCKAFLLSESSLFVWHDRFLLLTCGETRLIDGIEYFLSSIDQNNILQLIYQRKNEYVTSVQPSHFFDDIRQLDGHMHGVAYRFGQLHDHHNYMFHLDNDYRALPQDKTYELLAYQIGPHASELLTNPNVESRAIRQLLQLDVLLPGFMLDDHVFEPFGYSLNALKGDQYLTIHVTPQAVSSYVSFEANFDLIEKAPLLLSILEPASFDLVSFNVLDFAAQVTRYIPAPYVAKALEQDLFSIGCDVCFASFIRPQSEYTKPSVLALSGESYTF